MNKTGISYLDYTWNPGGFGCSNNCQGCWAKRMAGRMQCPDCKAFRVHFHPERLDQPAKLQKPSAIGVQFTGELFDPKRPCWQVFDVLKACDRAKQHDYIFLTQQPQIMADAFDACPEYDMSKWYKGLTIRTQAEADERLPMFLKIPGNLWLSIEPQREEIQLAGIMVEADNYIASVVVGCDNLASVPFDLDWARSIVEQCKAAGVPVYVKQLRIDGKLLHCPKSFPKDLRLRELPWKLRTKKP